MTRPQADLAALSRFVFRAPDWSASLFLTLFVAAVVGVAAFDSQFLLDDAYRGMIYVGLPTVVAAFLTPPIDRALGGKLTYNRSALLAFVCEVVVVVFLVAAAAVVTATDAGQSIVSDALVVALASIFAFRLFVITAVSRRSLPIAAISASIQTVAAAVLGFVYGGAVGYLAGDGLWVGVSTAPTELLAVRPSDFALLAALCAVYAFAVWVFLRAIDRPWRRNLGVSVLDFVRGFLGHTAAGSDELEAFFEDLGESAIVPVAVLSVRRLDGTEKARFVVPAVHPGPMGEIGGGNLPERIATATEGLAFVPHAAAGHDFNLVTEREVDALIEAAERAGDRIEYGRLATHGDREREGDSAVLGQAIGEDALLVATHAPEPADDIAFSVGLSVSAEARAAGLREAAFVDAHNCNDGLTADGAGRIGPGSRRSFDLMSAAGRLAERLTDAERGPLSVGTANADTDWTLEEGIGPLGVRVAVFDVGGRRTVYALVDGNNMDCGLRDAIIGAIDADEVEVMTTDTHVVNTVSAANQVGGAIESDRLVDLVAELVDEAEADLEPVEAGLAIERADVTVFGTDRTEALAATANAMVQIGGALLLIVVAAALAVSVLIFLVAG
jgi:putative membrane protein